MLRLGLGIGLLLAGAREAFAGALESDVEDALEKPVLATIQSLPKRAGIVVVGRHESRWGDTYALLAANLMQIRSAKDGPMVLAVTSSIAGEGKADDGREPRGRDGHARAARRHRRVRLRKPTISRMFKIPRFARRHPARRRQATLDLGDLEDRGQRLGPSGIVAVRPEPATEPGLTARKHAPRHRRGRSRAGRPGRTLAAGSQLLAKLGASADVVLLDTPPALATVEMAELSGSVDAVLVVVRHGRVTGGASALNRQAEGWRADIVGAVLTDSPSEEDEYYYTR